MPRLNRLSGPFWWRRLPPREKTRPGEIGRQGQDVARHLQAPGPCALGKIGTTELLALEYFERWIRPPWPRSASWYRPAQRLFHTAGVFPIRRDIFFRFGDVYRATLADLDLVALWQPPGTFESVLERAAVERWASRAARTGFYFIRFVKPYATWLEDLARLRWLVIHPFGKTIRHQLPRIAEFGIFAKTSQEDLKIRIRDTQVLACPQLPYMVPPRHADWFQALEEMKAEMEKKRDSFDIALVGAGAWSLPLTVHAKTLGKKGLHMGGALQLLFGIKGGRFDPADIYNPAWIRPLPEELPANHRLMENGAYW